VTGTTTNVDLESADPAVRIDLPGLQALFQYLADDGYQLIGPQVADGVIAHGPISSVDDLPLGWTDEQAPGRYELVPRHDRARFGYAVGPQSWKELLHRPRQQVWSISRSNGDEGDERLTVKMAEHEVPRRAFIGVRPCELAAIAKQDNVLLGGPFPDPAYGANRRDVFIVSVDCGDPADTCFCTSMGTGPASGPGCDGSDPVYVVHVGSVAGRAALSEALDVADRPLARPDEQSQADQVVDGARQRINRRVDTNGIRDRIYANLEGPIWESVGERCLSCGNCTMVCPTCFCTTMEDVTDLGGDNTDRWRLWDSCFSDAFSHAAEAGPMRDSTASRYRQWFVHKLASWHDQFDESGCVGCGRCIAWCPVGIDLTEELKHMGESQRTGEAQA